MQCSLTEVPFELDEDRGGIVVPVVVNGRPGAALLDTGAGHTVVSPELLGSPDRLASGSFASDRPGFVATRSWAMASLRVGPADFGRQRVQAMDMSEVSRAYRRRVDGLIGQDVLVRFGRVVIDFDAHQVKFVKGESERCPGAE